MLGVCCLFVLFGRSCAHDEGNTENVCPFHKYHSATVNLSGNHIPYGVPFVSCVRHEGTIQHIFSFPPSIRTFLVWYVNEHERADNNLKHIGFHLQAQGCG